MEKELRLITWKMKRELKKVMKQTEVKLMKLFPSILSYDVMTGYKLYLSHDMDPPWDHSGSLCCNFPGESFDLADYEQVEDFLEEYTGKSVATSISNQGLHYETYREKYIDWFREQYRNAQDDYFNTLGSEVMMRLTLGIRREDELEGKAMDSLNHVIDELEACHDHSYIYAENSCAKISGMDLLLVYKQGMREAEERLRQEQIDKEKAAKQMQVEKEAFAKFWPLLEKKYKLAHQKPIPKRIELADFKMFQQFLDQQHVSQEQKVLIAKYANLSFSNAVSSKLTHQDPSLY